MTLQEENAQLHKQINELIEYLKKDLEIMDLASDLILRFNLSGRISFLNKSGLGWLNYELSELGSNGLEKIIFPEDFEPVKEHLNHHQENCPTSSYFEFRILTKRNETIWMGVNFDSIFNSDNHVEITGIGRDITKIRNTQEQLSNNISRLETILVNLQTGILLEDEHRKIILVNKKFCNMFNIPLPPEEMVGMDCSQSAEQVKHLFKQSEEFVQRISEILSLRNISVGERLELADNKIFERDFIPVFAEGKYLGHLWQYRDITNQNATALSNPMLTN